MPQRQAGSPTFEERWQRAIDSEKNPPKVEDTPDVEISAEGLGEMVGALAREAHAQGAIGEAERDRLVDCGNDVARMLRPVGSDALRAVIRQLPSY